MSKWTWCETISLEDWAFGYRRAGTFHGDIPFMIDGVQVSRHLRVSVFDFFILPMME
jgi:hypothetical protein